MSAILDSVALGSLGLAAYHHAGFPLLLKFVRRPTGTPDTALVQLPPICIVMPAFNEADQIVAKLRNIAALDYPAGCLRVTIICDGCSDATAALAHATLAEAACAHLDAEVIEHRENRGKVAVLNETLTSVQSEIVVLTDVSAILPGDALRRAAAHFVDPRVGAVGGTYRFEHAGSVGESAYWSMQLGVKRGEAALGAPLGLHGAFYAFRRIAWAALPRDTINDDFILPMQIFARGWRVTYDEQIVALEAERADPAMEQRRRRRIAAGNAQQLIRLAQLLHPRYGGVAFAFASGKALRVAMPFLLMTSFVCSLASADKSPLFASLTALQVLGAIAAIAGLLLGPAAPRPLMLAGYLVAGHWANLVGFWRYASGQCRGPWQRAVVTPVRVHMHLPLSVAVGKRSVDFAVAALSLVLTAPLWLIITLAIRLESPGPSLSGQLLVGRARPDRTELFRMNGFRTTDVRTKRPTRVGQFLCVARLDRLPRTLNLLRGDLSLVGPGPEPPHRHGELEAAIPFFAERMVGVRPGITSLTHVVDRSGVEPSSARRRVMFDHAYTMRLVSIGSWLRTDTRIILRVVLRMVTKR